MREGEKVDDYFARTLTIVNKMKAHGGENMTPVEIIEKILRSLTSRFDYVVCSIEESNDLDLLTIDELQSSLLVHEQRLNRHNGDMREEQALKVSYGEQFEGRNRGKGFVARGRGRGSGRQFLNKATVECFKCHKLGHFQYECPNWEKGVNYAQLDEDEELLLMSSNHMSGDKRWFTDIDEKYRHSVKLGNNMRMPVIGKGNIKIVVDGVTQVISDVFYVPELKNNLLSIGQLQERGLAILIKEGTCRVYHSKRGLIMQSQMTANRMFVIFAKVTTQDQVCFKSTFEDKTELWHRRFSHLSHKGLRTLQYKQMVKGLPQIKAASKVCEHCMIGKQHREAIPKKSLWRASQQLQLVHADICGPITPTSNSNKRYLISFIDDYSRKMWVYFLAEKSEAFTTFKNYKVLVEKEIGASICCLRTDRGGEFTSFEFNEYCKVNGVKRQLTAAYTPQQNGVAERKNRTIMNMVRCMLSEKQMPKTF